MLQMITIFKNIIKCIALVSSLSFSCLAQNLAGIQKDFNNYFQNNLTEKLFVHTDRQDYLAGEIIWFKVYDVDGLYNKPLDLSKVAYVDVLDNQQNPVMQAKIVLNKGSGSGSLFIPLALGSGNYKLRAYTSWMKNFSPEYYFETIIKIVNPQIVYDVKATQNKPGYDIQFFPEGGNLVNGIKSRVAFKAAGPDGKGIDFTGAVIDQKNDTVVKFSPLKFGMGSFAFTPAKNNTYTAVIRGPDSKPVIKALPAIADDGYVMQLNDNGPNQLDVSVSSGSPAGLVYIFIHTRQTVKLAKEAGLANGVAHFRIDKSLLDEGISHLTVFNSERQPVCERLYFKRPADKLFIAAKTDQLQYSTRQKVTISVETKDRSGEPLAADLSMSVYRLDAFQTASTGDILSYFWLSADLQGIVESPGYYFSNNSPKADEAADNLMLTQGWRRFEWKNVLSNKPASFSFLPETYGHLVMGKIVNAATNAPASGIITYLGVPGKRTQLFVSKSDSSGNLLFNTKDFYGDEIVVQPNTPLDSIYRIDISNPFSEQYSKRQVPLIAISTGMQETIEERNLGMQVQNIYSGNKIKQFYEPAENNSGFYKKPANSYLLDDYTRFTTMEEVLREYIKEVNIVQRQKRFHIKVLGERAFLDGDPLVLFDGIPQFNMDKVMAVDPLLIKKLAVVPQTYFYGPSVQQGILNYTSYKGNLGTVDIDPHALVVDYEGMQEQRVFYSPVYETEAQIKSHLPDFRSLLFWSPSISANTNIPVTFYTSDKEGKYIGIVQGIAADGEAASSSFTFQVKK
jgi:hypothetical protein